MVYLEVHFIGAISTLVRRNFPAAEIRQNIRTDHILDKNGFVFFSVKSCPESGSTMTIWQEKKLCHQSREGKKKRATSTKILMYEVPTPNAAIHTDPSHVTIRTKAAMLLLV